MWDKESCLDHRVEIKEIKGKVIRDELLVHKPNLIHLLKLDFSNGEEYVNVVKEVAKEMKNWDAGSDTTAKYTARAEAKEKNK